MRASVSNEIKELEIANFSHEYSSFFELFKTIFRKLSNNFEMISKVFEISFVRGNTGTSWKREEKYAPVRLDFALIFSQYIVKYEMNFSPLNMILLFYLFYTIFKSIP